MIPVARPYVKRTDVALTVPPSLSPRSRQIPLCLALRLLPLRPSPTRRVAPPSRQGRSERLRMKTESTLLTGRGEGTPQVSNYLVNYTCISIDDNKLLLHLGFSFVSAIQHFFPIRFDWMEINFIN